MRKKVQEYEDKFFELEKELQNAPSKENVAPEKKKVKEEFDGSSVSKNFKASDWLKKVYIKTIGNLFLIKALESYIFCSLAPRVNIKRLKMGSLVFSKDFKL